MSEQTAIAASQQIAVSLGDKPLGYKLDLVSALLVAARDAHREVMTPHQWHEINGALAHLGAATISGERVPISVTPVCTRWEHHQAMLKPAEGNNPRALPEGKLSPLEAWLDANPPAKR